LLVLGIVLHVIVALGYLYGVNYFVVSINVEDAQHKVNYLIKILIAEFYLK